MSHELVVEVEASWVRASDGVYYSHGPLADVFRFLLANLLKKVHIFSVKFWSDFTSPGILSLVPPFCCH